MPSEQFDALVRDATKGSARQRAAQPPRLIRARHHARSSSGVLSGKTELVIEAGSSGPADFVLDPWTPAILPEARSATVLGARDSGKPSLWIDQAPNQIIAFEWELQPRSHSWGRSFTLALPGEEMTVLALEIPKDWVPSSRRGQRRGPVPSTDPGLNLWEIEAESGRIDLQLLQPKQGESLIGTNPWLAGSTQIDLRRTTSRSAALVNWTTDWRVEFDPRNPKRLDIELDPGLELIDVQGPAVRGYRTERAGMVTRLAVTLNGGLKSSTELHILAHARVPSEGPWTIPALRPKNATWTGGTTTVILDEFHVLEECREKAGRRVWAGPGDPGGFNRLVFESESPHSPAELVFRKPRAESRCEVRGQLFASGSPCRLECQLIWRFPHGSMSELEIDLSPAWLPDRVLIQGLEDPVAWHPSVLPSGITRLHVALPATALAQDEVVLFVGATSTVPGGRGPLELPRVRPADSRLVDEAWLAWVDKTTMIQPTAARGLAWIDPSEVSGLQTPRPAGSDLREALAWRWTADRALARVDREQIEQEPSATVRIHAQVDVTGRLLTVDGRLVVSAGALSLDSVPIWVGQTDDSLKSWRFHDEAGGIELAPRPIDGPARARLGFPTNGSARSLAVKVASQTEKTIHFHAECPWSSRGEIPLIAVSRNYLFRGMILVETPAGMRSRVKNVGLRRLDPSAGDQPELEPDIDIAAETRDDRSAVRKTIVHALAYDKPGGQLELFTEPVAPLYTAGIIREALLTTAIDPKGTTLNRLRLLVHSGAAHSLDLVAPSDLSLVRIRRDGLDLAPIQSRTGWSIPLPGSSPGPRSSTILIDYVKSGGQIADGGQVRPDLPGVGLPCLSFDWEVVIPRAWKAADCGSGWIASDPANLSDWPYAALGLWKPAWDLIRGRRGDVDAELLRVLDDRLVDSVSAELTFAEWFSRWDSGPLPVVIDRVSLNAAGFGPKSQCVPRRAKAERRSVSLATLEQHGLAIVRFPNALLIATEGESPKLDQRDRWAQAIAESLFWGSDRTDRFQTLPRWRGEPSPKIASTAGDESADRIKLPQGWSTWRFAGPRWPGNDSFVYLIDARARMIRGWIIAMSSLLVWFSCRRRLVHRRFLVLTSVMSAIVVIEWFVPSRYASYTAALFIATFATLMLELGQAVGQAVRTGRTRVRPESSLVRRMAASSVGLALAGLVLGGLASGQPAGRLDHGSAVLALYPYEGAFDPTRPARDVILRLADFTRLSRLAAGDVAPPFTSVRATSAWHRVARKSAPDIDVDSEIELIASGQAPFGWRIPVSAARDIEATLDGERLPISIEPGGVMGTLAIPRAGNHVLRIHRSAAARAEAGFETLSLPVNAMPSARVVVEPPRDGEQQGELNALGGTRLQADRSVTGRLGPADRVEVRWPKPNAAVAPRAAGPIDGLILWDINRAGDRIRARFTFQQPQDPSTIRFAHQPGLILRSGRAGASVETVWEENARQDEWTLRADPPLQAGATIELDCWMPADATRADGGKSPAAGDVAAGSVRRLPRLQPIGVERYSGSVGVRRPGDWSGRFDPIPDTEPISDESFVKSWGSLPEEPLTLCGTSRFVRDCRASLSTGPAPTRIQVKPTVQLQLESGRIAMTVEAELSELSGHLRQIEAQLPEGIRVISVTADGLTDWTTSPDRRLRLIFDRPLPRPRRLLRVLAWIPLSEDPLKIGARQHRIPVPWIGWNGMEGSAGFLTVSSISKPELRGSTGLAIISSESSGAGGTTPPRHRVTYRVDDPRKLGEILWDSIPARVKVSIESQMTIHPDSAEWVAVLRYDVVGGALDVIHLKMPAAWAAGAELRLTGGEHQLTTETRGPFAFWTITPERPVWGSQRFVLRSSRSLGDDRELVYPEISPLGKGAVDAYLSVVNATGRPPTIENSTGLEKIPYATRFQSREFAGGAGVPVSAFRVVHESWALLVQSPRNVAEASDSQDGSARVALSDMMVVALPDRSTIGRAVYETVPLSGSHLAFELPADSSLLWATVDSNPINPLRSSSGTWAIALDDRRQSRVSLIWKTGAAVSSSSGSTWPVNLPKAGIGPATTLVAVCTPPQVMIRTILAGLEPAAMARVEMARADWLARSIGEFVARIDRSSGRDHEKLVSLLINQEMALRTAERSDLRRDPSAAKTENDGTEQNSARIRAVRAARVETTRRAGLEADLASVQSYLGESPADLTRPLVGVPEPTTPDRIRFFGRHFTLMGVMPGIHEPKSPNSLILEDRPWEESGNHPPIPAIVTLVLLLGIALATIGSRRRVWVNLLALIMALGLAGYTGGPMVLAGGLGLAAAGWKTARG